MNFLEALGFCFLVCSSTIGTVLIVWSVYKHVQNVLRTSLRGMVEERRDCIQADKVREALR